MAEQFNQELLKFTLEHPNPKTLIESLCLFKKLNFLEKNVVNRFFYCLQHNPEKKAESITPKFIERQQTRLGQSFKPNLAVIEEEPKHYRLAP